MGTGYGRRGAATVRAVADAPAPHVIRRLDGDLVVRRAEAADIDAVVALNVEVFGPQDAPGPRALLSGGVDVEWLIVAAGPGADEPGGGTLACACARIPLDYELDGVVLRGSQIENVTTDERFRRRGLVRALFDAHHERAADAGELLQVIGGIPYFYRKLGYGYGFDVPATIRVGPSSAPALDTGRISVRAARPDDVEWLLGREGTRRRDGLTVLRTRASLETWVERTAPVEGVAWESFLVAQEAGRPVGWLRTIAWAEEAQLFLLPGEAPDLDVAGQLLAHSLVVGQELADGIGRPLEVLASDQPGTPWSRAIHAAGRPRPEPSGYYVRVADPVALLTAMEPVLSRRIAASGLAHDRGELLLSLYDRGVLLAWEGGRVTRIEAAAPDPDPFDKGGVGVAPDWFPALAFGRWGASGLAARTDDTLLGDHAGVMDVLFPARPNDLAADL
jgi:ribosomal protein S18 acetylase RimI-like enzyme